MLGVVPRPTESKTASPAGAPRRSTLPLEQPPVRPDRDAGYPCSGHLATHAPHGWAVASREDPAARPELVGATARDDLRHSGYARRATGARLSRIVLSDCLRGAFRDARIRSKSGRLSRKGIPKRRGTPRPGRAAQPAL
jgi:hypothetical protein